VSEKGQILFRRGRTGGELESVAPGSLGEAIGLRPGDIVHSIDGKPLRDVIDYQFYTGNAGTIAEIAVEREGEQIVYEVELEGDDLWGLGFTEPTFDGIRRCTNDCPFCFVKQVPRGMRRTLYIKDDDYRYSFLYGNFVTLTNLSEEDWARIGEQGLSPLNVSVHATDPQLRVDLLRHPRAGAILDDLRRLANMGIEYNTQLVLNPGINDGDQLDRSVSDLKDLPGILSIAAVPVGLTPLGIARDVKKLENLALRSDRDMPGLPASAIRKYTEPEVRDVIRRAETWQRRFRAERGENFLYLGDEFYLMVGESVPPSRFYDGFPQLEDGIGITRTFLDDWAGVKRRRGARRPNLSGVRATLACATLIAPTMERVVGEFNALTGAALRVRTVPTGYFGPEIVVSGLLTGSDILTALRDDAGEGPILLPRVMFSRLNGLTLDDMSIEQLEAELGRPMLAAHNLSEVARQLAALGASAAA
jgi:NifB/MoaA-like Fe-S oxidoreductase